MRYGFRFSGLVSASLPCDPPQDRDVRNVASLQGVTLQAVSTQPVLIFAPARAGSNNPCSRPTCVILLCSTPALRDVPRATLLLPSPAQGQAPVLEHCSLRRTARIYSQLVFQSTLTFLTKGLSNFEKEIQRNKFQGLHEFSLIKT